MWLPKFLQRNKEKQENLPKKDISIHEELIGDYHYHAGENVKNFEVDFSGSMMTASSRKSTTSSMNAMADFIASNDKCVGKIIVSRNW